MALDPARPDDMSEMSKAPLGRVPPAESSDTKTIARTLLVSVANGPLAGETLHYGFDLINFDYRTWHEYEWGNWVAVDALLNAAFRGVADVQIWTTSHGYIVDDVVVSTETGLAYVCLVAHTSNNTSITADLALGYWLETIIGDSYTKEEADVLFVNVAGDIMTGPLTLYANPAAPAHAANKAYVDLLDANQKVYIDNANNAQDAANTGALAAYMPKSGGTFTGPVLWATAPTVAGHLTNKTYVDLKDTQQKTYIDGLDAAQKTYIDAADAALLSNINTRMRWKGAWAAGTYVINDVVTDTGYLFVAKQTTTQKPYTGKPPAPTQWDILAGGGGGSSVIVSATPPTQPVQGDMWFSTVEPVGLFVWYDDGSGAQWVQTNGGAGTACLPLTGGTLTGPLTLGSTAPTLYFAEEDQIDPAGRFRLIADGDAVSFQKALTANWATRSNLWSYAASTDKFTINRTLAITGNVPVLEFDELDATSPLGHYRFWLDGGTFSFQSANTANFATYENVFQFKSKGDGGTGTFNVFPGMSINGVVGNSSAPLKLDASYPAIWFHDSTPSGISPDLLLSAGNGWWRFSTAAADGAIGDDYFTINPSTPMVHSYLPLTIDLRTLGGTSNYSYTTLVPAGVNAYALRILDENSLERFGLYSSSTNNVVLRNRNGTASTVSYLQLNADTSAIIGAAGGVQVATLRLDQTPAGVAVAGRLATTEVTMGIQVNAVPANNGIHTYFRDSVGTSVATVYGLGTASPGGTTIMTREKGDLRFAAASSRRYKEDIVKEGDGIAARSMDSLISAFNSLTLSRWTWGGEIPEQDERYGMPGVGLIAEEVVEVFPEAVSYQWVPVPQSADEEAEQLVETEKRINGLDPLALIAMLIAKIRAQDERIAALEAM